MDFNDYLIYRYFKGGLWIKTRKYGWLVYSEFLEWTSKGILLDVVKSKYY